MSTWREIEAAGKVRASPERTVCTVQRKHGKVPPPPTQYRPRSLPGNAWDSWSCEGDWSVWASCGRHYRRNSTSLIRLSEHAARKACTVAASWSRPIHGAPSWARSWVHHVGHPWASWARVHKVGHKVGQVGSAPSWALPPTQNSIRDSVRPYVLQTRLTTHQRDIDLT